MKKNNTFKIIISILIILLILVLIYGGINGWFNNLINYNTNNQYVNYLNNQTQTDTSCVLTLSKLQACVNENVTMTFKDGKNAACRLFFKYNNNDWKPLIDVHLNSNGLHYLTRSAQYSGLYIFAAVCLKEDSTICTTNRVNINIIDCGNDTNDSNNNNEDNYIDCKLIKNPTSQASCNSGYCGTGSNMACVYFSPTLVTTARCDCVEQEQQTQPSCSDTDGGENIYEKGTCSDGSVVITDNCMAVGYESYLNENWCYDGTCWGASTKCPGGYICLDGRCTPGI